MADLFDVLRKAAMPIIGTIILLGIILFAFQQCNGMRAARDAGAATQSATTATKGLSDVEAANRAADAVARDDRVRDADCVRHSRTPDNC